MSNQFEHLFSPIEIRKTWIKNRICCSAHADSLSENGLPKEKVRAYYELKAKGGCGFMMCFGSASVHPSSPAKDWNGVELFSDEVIPYLQKFSETMHRYEVPVVAQITHRGRRGRSHDTFEPLYGPSAIPEPNHREVPHVVDENTLKSFITAYADAAFRLKEGGFDGCEVMASHGHLIDQFWSHNSNRREDKFGGSLENRLRFGIEVLEAVRKRVGDDFIVGIRMTGDDFTDKGLDVETCMEIASALDKHSIIDYFNIIGGTAETYIGEATAVPNMSFPLAVYTPLSAAIRTVVKAPVIATGRINDPTVAEQILKEGKADLCIMNRALIADPDFPQKAREGRTDDIRQCMGYNQGCIDRIYTGLGVMCVQNPIIGRETVFKAIDKTNRRKRIVIVGGGPAGLECARVSRMSGHEVILFEKEAELGGQTLIAKRAPARQDFDGACRFMAMQCHKLGVTMHLKTPAHVSLILEQNAEVVVLASGAKAKKPSISGLDRFGYSAWEVLMGVMPAGDRILVIDEEYGFQAPSVAEYLLDAGKEVHIVTSEPSMASNLGSTSAPVVFQRLFSKGVQLTGHLSVSTIEGKEAIAQNVWSKQEESLGQFDSFVYAFGGEADDSLHEALLKHVPSVELIGDCFAPRTLQHAIYEGHKLARTFGQI